MSDKRNIGLFFGSFNPVHTGHLIIGSLATDALGLEEMWLVVSPQNPFKLQSDLAPEKWRVKMVEAACAVHPKLQCCTVELDLPRPSYTIQTLRALKKQYPSVQFTLLLGEDNLPRFHEWKEIEHILTLSQVVVYKRSVKPYEVHQVWKDKVQFLDSPILDISATQIRDRVEHGLPITYLVHPSTEQIITKNGLYK
jgi:nicotinate-nucleotide adenylyltransferase